MIKSPFFNRSKKRSKVLSFLLAFVIAFVPMVFNFPTDVQAATTLVTYPAPAGVTHEHHLYGASTGSRRSLAERGRV